MWEHNLVSYEYWESCHPLNWYCDWCVQLLSVFHFTSLTRPHFNEASNLRIRKGKRKRGGEQRKGVNDQGARRAWVKGTTKMLPSAFQGCFLKPCYSSKFSPVILKRRFPGRFYAFFGGVFRDEWRYLFVLNARWISFERFRIMARRLCLRMGLNTNVCFARDAHKEEKAKGVLCG